MVSLYIDPDSAGAMVEDCEVCCRPWQLEIDRDEDGELSVRVQRA
jgi:hypothetical protein